VSHKSYYTDEAIIPVPPGFIDRSTHVLEWKAADGERIGLLVHRQQLEPATLEGEERTRAFDALVTRETKDYTKRFAGLRWEREDDETPDAAMPVRRRAFRFRHDDAVLYQCQAFMLLGRRVVVMTAASKAVHRDEVDRLIDEAIAGLKVWDE
jgi:hypothetical protein